MNKQYKVICKHCGNRAIHRPNGVWKHTCHTCQMDLNEWDTKLVEDTTEKQTMQDYYDSRPEKPKIYFKDTKNVDINDLFGKENKNDKKFQRNS